MENMQSTPLISLKKCNINMFRLRQKAVIYSGPLSIKISARSVEFWSHVKVLEIPHKTIIARIQEIDYITYLKLNQDGGVYSFSLHSNDMQNQNFLEIIKEHFEVVEFFSLPPDMEYKVKLLEDCPIGQAGASQLGANNDDKITQIGEGIGNAIGGISSLVDFDKINRTSNETVNRMSKDIFGDNVLSKWQRFKLRCSKINDTMTDVLKPVNQKLKQIANGIGENFDKSDNSFIENVRIYSKKTEVALNSGYDKRDAPRRATYTGNRQSYQVEQKGQKKINLENNSRVIGNEKLNQRHSLL